MKLIPNVICLVISLAYSGVISALGSTESISDELVKVDKPNILLIVADDLGFSDLGAFGGEIETPNLDSLATSGVRLTNFYATPSCSPTRSMLLTGQDNHPAGMGAMAEALQTFSILKGKPGYEGYLKPETTTIAEVLSNAGYRTLMSGKWHLGSQPNQQPTEHGFDRAFALMQGGADHFGAGQNGGPALQPATYTENGRPAEFPVGSYSSDVYAERLIDYLNLEDKSDKPDQPFFAYLAFTAPHWPLQAPAELIEKYKDRYNAGPEALRSARFERMKRLGLIDSAVPISSLVVLDDWQKLSEQQRKVESRNMEIYAAMVDSLDQNVGRVLDQLRVSGEYDNTVIIFMSDNGAEGIGARPLIGRTSNSTPPQHKAAVLAAINAGNLDLSKMGTGESFITYGSQWAQAAMAPFRRSKGDTEEGGVRVPAFISGPAIKGQRIISSALSVRDVMPTVLDITHTAYSDVSEAPVTAAGVISMPSAKSWKPILDGSLESVRSDTDAIAWELHLKRGIRVGDWKAVYGKDTGDRSSPSSWKLYNLSDDIAESNDVSAENSQVLERLVAAWGAYAKQNGVFVPGPPQQKSE
jgi:arylsulfatase A-like enzyme